MARLKGIERLPRVLPGGSGRRKRPRHDHLRGRIGDLSSREARRHRVSGRREVRVPLVDAVVDDRDLDPLTLVREAGLPRRPGGRAGCDLGRGARVRRARIDLLDAREGSQQGQGGGRHDDGRPLRTRRYRQRTCAVGMDARRAVTNRAWSASTAARAARPASPDRPATAGAVSVTTTSLAVPPARCARPAGPAGTRLQSTSARPHSVNAWSRGTSARRDEGTGS